MNSEEDNVKACRKEGIHSLCCAGILLGVYIAVCFGLRLPKYFSILVFAVDCIVQRIRISVRRRKQKAAEAQEG